MKKTSTRIAVALVPALMYVFVLPSAFAQPVVYDRFVTSGGIEILTGPNYVPKTVQQYRGQAIWNNAMSTADGGLPEATGSQMARNPSGNAVALTAKARIPAVEIGKAVGRAAVELAGKAALVLGAGVTLYNLANEIGFILSRNSDGTVKYEKAGVVVEGGYRHGLLPVRATRLLACTTDWIPYAMSANPTYTVVTQGLTGNVCGGTMKSPSNQTYAIQSDTATYTAPSNGQPVVATQQELIDAVAAKSGWPSTSNVNKLLQEDLAAGNKLATGPITVTGPATSPGTTSQTQKSNGNTVTTTTTHNHTYSGPQVTTTTTTVTNNYNPTTNITETETTVETPPAEEQEPEVSVTDTPLPDQPKLYEPKYPQGLVGVWQEKKDELTATPLANLLGQLMPSVGSGGSCPAWHLNLAIGPWDYGTNNVAPPCYIWDWCKFFIIAGALLLARALIFGG